MVTPILAVIHLGSDLHPRLKESGHRRVVHDNGTGNDFYEVMVAPLDQRLHVGLHVFAWRVLRIVGESAQFCGLFGKKYLETRSARVRAVFIPVTPPPTTRMSLFMDRL